MNSNWIFIAYYVFCTIIIVLTGYVVFILDHNGAWFLLTLLLISNSPSITNVKKSDDKKEEK